MFSVTLCRFDEIGDEVVASFEFSIDVSPGVADVIAKTYETIVGDDDIEAAEKERDDKEKERAHSIWVFGYRGESSVCDVR